MLKNDSITGSFPAPMHTIVCGQVAVIAGIQLLDPAEAPHVLGPSTGDGSKYRRFTKPNGDFFLETCFHLSEIIN